MADLSGHMKSVYEGEKPENRHTTFLETKLGKYTLSYFEFT